MIPITYDLISDLTFTINMNEEVFVKVNGTSSYCVLSIKVPETAQCIVQSTIASNEFTNLIETTYADCLWEDIKVNGISLPIISESVSSTTFWSPNLLYFKNVSLSELPIQVSLRGNR
ncbi:MAG: hypothetical protein AB7V16_06945 [Vulcanibacillus sp.]